jgi:lipopolysaccharide transport system permease protein
MRDSATTDRELAARVAEVAGRAAGPDKPVTVIKPQRGIASLGLRDVWVYRELLYFLIWRDIKVRYKQSGFGAAWALVQPVGLMVVFTIFLNRIAGIASYGVAYPVFAFAGLIVWTLFAQGLLRSSESLVSGSALVSKVYFPRLVLPIAATCSYLIDFVIGLGFLVLLLITYDVEITPSLGLAPLFAVQAMLVALAVGIWLAAINVRFRDVRYTLPFLIQLWLFATPVAYSANLIPERWQPMMALNPMSGVVQGFRWAVTGVERPSLSLLAISAAVTFGALVIGTFYFRSTERTFADVI